MSEQPEVPTPGDDVICPNCAHSFRAIPQDVQERLSVLTAENAELREKLQKAESEAAKQP